MSAPLQVRVLGPLSVQRAGQPVVLGSVLQRRLLTVLAVAAGATVSTSRLIDQLWDADPPPAARNSLQSHVARLRAALGADAIVTHPPGYALDLGVVELDAVAFEEAVVRARGQLRSRPAAAAQKLAEALACWRGPAHAEFADGLARGAAVRLEHLRVDARCLLAGALERAGDPAAAVDTLLRLVAEEPLREDVALATAGLLHRAGRTADGLAVLRDHRDRLADELGLDPGAAVATLEQQLLRGDPPDPPPPADAAGGAEAGTVGGARLDPAPRPPQAAPAAPPRADTPTFGRERDLGRVDAALSAGRLVTLVGPGGVGKTRVATESAGARAAGAGDRVAWVDLFEVPASGDVLPVVVEALGATVPSLRDGAAVATALARFAGVVVLDGCEHVLDAVAALVDRALAQPGAVRVLATSRERLDLPAEQVVALAPLPVPDPAGASDRDPAVQLFQDRLVAAGGAPVTAAEAAEVVAAVDGLPLAIELAATRAATLPVADLLARFDRHLDVLAASARRHGQRQRTLTSVIAWSHDLLTAPEQALFRRLSVFATSFRVSDAEQVCAGGRLPPAAVVEALVRLVEQSMVARVGAGRYRLLEPLRLFAAQELRDSGDADLAHERHRAFALQVAARADAGLTAPEEAHVVSEVERALPDLRAAHARALAQHDLVTVARLAGWLYRFAYAQARGDVLAWGGPLRDADPGAVPGDDRLRAITAAITAAAWRNDTAEAGLLARRAATSLDDDAVAPATGMAVAESVGDFFVGQGRLGEAADAYERGVALARAAGRAGLVAYLQASRAVARIFQGRSGEGEALAREAFGLASSPPVPTARSLAAYAIGEALADRDPDAALEAFQTAIDEATAVRARFFEGIARTADVALRGRHGDPLEALARYRAALQVWHDAGADGMALTTLRNLVILLARTGADTDAVSLHAALERLATRGSYGPESDRLRGALAAASERLPPDAAAAAVRAGAALDDLPAVTRFGRAAIDRLLRG